MSSITNTRTGDLETCLVDLDLQLRMCTKSLIGVFHDVNVGPCPGTASGTAACHGEFLRCSLSLEKEQGNSI